MKSVLFENKFTHEKVMCKDINLIKEIDGVSYLMVSKLDNKREFLMRKDALKQVKVK